MAYEEKKTMKINPGAVWIGLYKDKKTGEEKKKLTIKVNLEFFPGLVDAVKGGAKTITFSGLPNDYKEKDIHPDYNLRVSNTSEVQGLGAVNAAPAAAASKIPQL